MIGVTGVRTTIVMQLAKLSGHEVERIDCDLAWFTSPVRIPPSAKHFVLAAGMLHSKPLREQTEADIHDSLAVNLITPMRICDAILDTVPEARICVIGSVSGFNGSYDGTYAAAKAGLHAYVKNKPVSLRQQIFALAPTIIADSGMTVRRMDYPEVLGRRPSISAKRVAQEIHSYLFGNSLASNFIKEIA